MSWGVIRMGMLLLERNSEEDDWDLGRVIASAIGRDVRVNETWITRGTTKSSTVRLVMFNCIRRR